ncbi:hypothetical protein DSO57_1012344 [Entomophthora muscae]|uniref:Uncharacterized protein n=1 Tax=Entomophthora muscae TaxID=34485 RepID=A0ACC2SV00_9FUNG|nr:hypothetical protein DSO57_1012344 [Entomophthora muscae]
MVPAPGFSLKSKNPGAGKSPLPASPTWWLGAGLIPARGFEAVTSVTVYNKLCEFTEAFAGQRLYLVVYLRYLFYFGTGASVEDLDRVLLGIDKAWLSLDGKKVPPGYKSVDHVIQDNLVLAGIYGFAALPEKLLLHFRLTLLPFTSRREYFNKGASTVHSVAVEVVRHLHCGVGI